MYVGAESYYNNAVAAAKQMVKAGAAKVHAIHLVNTTGADAYLQVHDALTADVTIGTSTPKFSIRLAANATFTLPLTMPLKFTAGIVVAGTTTSGGNTGAAISAFMAYE